MDSDDDFNKVDVNPGTPKVYHNSIDKLVFGTPKVLFAQTYNHELNFGTPTIQPHKNVQVTYSVPTVTLYPTDDERETKINMDFGTPTVPDLTKLVAPQIEVAQYKHVPTAAVPYKQAAESRLGFQARPPFTRVLHCELDPDFIEYLDEFSQLINSGLEIISRSIHDYRFIVLERAVRDLNNAIVMIRHTRGDVSIKLGTFASTPKVPPMVPLKISVVPQSENSDDKVSNLAERPKLARFYTFPSLLMGASQLNAPINRNNDQ